MIKRWLLFLGLAVPLAGHANSFVGNGGNDGDVEWLVTLKQIKETFRVITKHAPEHEPLCRCNKLYEGRSVCEPLKALSESQATFCSEALYKQASAVLALVERPEAIQVHWTNSPIEVTGSTEGHMRASDAVADPQKRELTLNQPHFRGLSSRDRVYLVTHELLHFTTLDGKPLGDDGEIGPFAGAQGERHLVDAMAASASVLQGVHPREIPTYRAQLYRSQAQKHFWFSMDFGTTAVEHPSDDTFAFSQYTRSQFSFRYQWTHWGLVAAYRNENNSKRVINAIDAREELNTVGAGVTYRIFVASDPLTFWGQSHLMLQFMVERIHINYEYHDDYTGENVTRDVWGGSFSPTYYLPLFWGLWGYVGTAYEWHPYTYDNENLNFNHRAGNFSGFLGVSYAF